MLQLLYDSRVMQMVQADAKNESISHAYLAIWQDEENLKQCLKEIAKLILQADERMAKLIDREEFIDCKVYPPKDRTKEKDKKILVADVREILEDSCILPIETEKKVYILNNVQTMSAAAQNKILKLLEEPPKAVYFVLGTTQQAAVLQTVQSRSKLLQFGHFTESALLQFIDRHYPNAIDKQSAIVLANGNINRLQELLSAEESQFAPLYILQKVAIMQSRDIVDFTREYADKSAVLRFFASLQIVLRELLLMHIGNKESLLLQECTNGQGYGANMEDNTKQMLAVAVKRYKPSRILFVLDSIMQAVEEIEYNGNAVQSLYVVLIALLEGR